jgi:hypothetical protein
LLLANDGLDPPPELSEDSPGVSAFLTLPFEPNETEDFGFELDIYKNNHCDK